MAKKGVFTHELLLTREEMAVVCSEARLHLRRGHRYIKSSLPPPVYGNPLHQRLSQSTISRARAGNGVVTGPRGGCVAAVGGRLTVIESNLTECEAVGPQAMGGAFHVDTSCGVAFQQETEVNITSSNIIDANATGRYAIGGGIYMTGGAVRMTDSTISNAAAISDVSSPTIPSGGGVSERDPIPPSQARVASQARVDSHLLISRPPMAGRVFERRADIVLGAARELHRLAWCRPVCRKRWT